MRHLPGTVRAKLTTAVAATLLVLTAATATAQEPIAMATLPTNTFATPPELPVLEAQTIDFASFSDAEWLAFENERTAGLSSEYSGERLLALQEILFTLTRTENGKEHMQGLGFDLLNVYRFDRYEPARIMALQALSYLENDACIRHLSHYLDSERSPSVRRIGRAVVHQYVTARAD